MVGAGTMTKTHIYTRNAQTGERVKVQANTEVDALAVVADRPSAHQSIRELSIFPSGAVLACLDGGRVDRTDNGPVGPKVA